MLWELAFQPVLPPHLRFPNRMVFSLVGDGGALMTGSELATAVAKKAKLKIIVANNNHYGTIRYHQEVHYPIEITMPQTL